MVNRSEIIDCARKYLGIKFRHQGRILINNDNNNQVGCDCLGLIIGIAKNLNLKSVTDKMLSDCDVNNYTIIPDPSKLFNFCKTHFIKIAKNKMKQADIALMKFNYQPQHLAIIANDMNDNNFTIIHSYIQARAIIEQPMNNYWY
ncbi:C40 family peptidase, partial [Rickettsia endosymbiont of Cardiosporidium cionae]|uniref:hypothetical protein n=1 Tax=Rickettsia endosymbiont of Cardiosporidium cionae TaxID=2777155 RepID=UPI001892EB21